MKFRKILSVALSATLIASSVSLSAFAKETEDKKYDYVALGDSIAAGFGLENSDGTILTDRAVCVTPELLADPIKEAYATVFGKYLEEMGQANGCTTTATNLSAVGYRANDVAETILHDNFVGQTAVGILEGLDLAEVLPFGSIIRYSVNIFRKPNSSAYSWAEMILYWNCSAI